MTTELQHVGSCTGGNTIPLDDEGRAYHVGIKEGECADEILIVSDYALAEDIKGLFDHPDQVFERVSNRGYHTYTGEFKGKRISMISFGIGFAMIDFLIREVHRVSNGKHLVFIQLGTAPTVGDVKLGTPIVIDNAKAYEIDFENFSESNPCPYRFFKKPVPADSKVLGAIEAGLKAANIEYTTGTVASNPSFSAGISAPTKASGGVGCFDFKTEGLVEKVQAELGPIASLEMDTYPLYWTSARATKKDVFAGAVSIAGSNLKGEVLPYEEIHKRLLQVAPVLLEQLGNLQSTLQ